MGKLFNEDFARCVLLIWFWKGYCTSICELLLENLKVGTFDSKVELEFHHLRKLINFIWKGKPLHGWDGVDDACKESHDSNVSIDHGPYLRMEDFDSDMSRGNLVGGLFNKRGNLFSDT